jgi:hypothetical protein
MIDAKRAAVRVALLLAAMHGVTDASRPQPQSPDDRYAQMNSADITIRETTQPIISGQLVGVSNIWERDLPDERGNVAPRLSATLSIVEAASTRSRVERIVVGSVVVLGSDSYRVVRIDRGESAPGSITLRQL